jgi:hypothetical protein
LAPSHQLIGTSECKRSEAVIEELGKRKANNNEEAKRKLRDKAEQAPQALKKLKAQEQRRLESQKKKRKTHEGGTPAPSKKGKGGVNERGLRNRAHGVCFGSANGALECVAVGVWTVINGA